MTEKDNAKDKGGLGYPLLCDGWHDARKELPEKRGRYIVAVYNYERSWTREAIYDDVCKYFTDDLMNDIESKDVNGKKLVIVYGWTLLPEPPAFAK